MTATDLRHLFGATIKSQRGERGISQEELAERAGLHRTYISDVERGARNLSLDSIEKLAGALQLSIVHLFQAVTSEVRPAALVDILIVEDEPRDLELTLRAFGKAKLANPVHVVRDGAEALDFLFATGQHGGRKNRPLPGVILLDLNLPNIPGLKVLRRIKADPRTQEIPVVVLTVSNHDRDIAECRRLGAESYIVKPVGFQNFSEVTPHLRLEWALKKPARGGPVEIGRHESNIR
jgi:CheY-like chemotaxis protein